jgi:G:T/U-mismatch repair DNA glycosylase
MQIETHPFEPFLPENAVLLMLGSFPPQPKRWKMKFYYPNFINDMWRIFGLIFFDDKQHFILEDEKKFDEPHLIDFLKSKGVALYDTATVIRRLQDNASDKYLEVVEPTDIKDLLIKIPHCKAVVTTGEKATETIRTQVEVAQPKVGSYEPFSINGKNYRLYRMPSSSRAYPMSLEQKAETYRKMFEELGML